MLIIFWLRVSGSGIPNLLSRPSGFRSYRYINSDLYWWAFKKAHGLRHKLGPGFIGLLAYVVRAQH